MVERGERSSSLMSKVGETEKLGVHCPEKLMPARREQQPKRVCIKIERRDGKKGRLRFFT